MRAYDDALARLAGHDPSRKTERGQTVLAAVVARDARCDPPTLRVVSLGAGTKFLRAADIDADEPSGTRVRDCHAEVLARRGMKRFLYAQIREAAGEAKLVRSSGRAAERWIVLEPASFGSNASDEASTTARARVPGWRVRNGVTFHLYASSAPCGNATVKRFAKGSKEIFDATSGPLELPGDAHHQHDDWKSFGSVEDGQIAFLWKRDPSLVQESTERIQEDASMGSEPLEKQETSHKKKKKNDAARVSAIPPGTSTTGRVLTCSDKIAVWSCVGVQGALLLTAGLLAEPVKFTSIVVGRKFTRAICRRALCCRAHRFLGDARKTRSTVRDPFRDARHPAVLCTAVPFDASTYAEGEGASFEHADAVVAWLEGSDEAEATIGGDGKSWTAERLDGRTGARTGGFRARGCFSKSFESLDACASANANATDGSGKREGNRAAVSLGEDLTVSGVSRFGLAATHARVVEPREDENAFPLFAEYAARKKQAGTMSGYADAKREALSQPGLWSLATPHRHVAAQPRLDRGDQNPDRPAKTHRN
jgi:double-stranded RNA-specific adenosine deaminase